MLEVIIPHLLIALGILGGGGAMGYGTFYGMKYMGDKTTKMHEGVQKEMIEHRKKLDTDMKIVNLEHVCLKYAEMETKDIEKLGITPDNLEKCEKIHIIYNQMMQDIINENLADKDSENQKN